MVAFEVWETLIGLQWSSLIVCSAFPFGRAEPHGECLTQSLASFLHMYQVWHVETLGNGYELKLTMATGYTKLSQFMTDRKYVIFRKFQDLAARDLLYIQAELVQLSIEFDEAAQNDRESDDDRQHYDREWWYLSNSELRGLDSEQWKTAMKIRRKLREYCELINYTTSTQGIKETNFLFRISDDGVFQYAEIAAMTRPKKSELDLLRTWIESPHLGGGCGFLGRDLAGAVRASVYDENYLGDLMLLVNKRGEDDILTRFLAGPVLKGFHCFWKYWKVGVPPPAHAAYG